MIARRPATAASGSPPPSTLPRIVRSGVTPSCSCAPPRATRKPVITSSSTSSAPDESHSSRSSSRKPLRAGTRPMFAAIGSARIAATLVVDRSLHSLRVVPRHDDRVARLRRGHTRRCRDALRRETRSGLGQQAVDVAVVVAGELDDLGAAGGGTCEPHRCHRRLRARRDQAHHLRRGNTVDHLRCKLDLRLGRRAEARAALGGTRDRLDHPRMRMPEDQRPPRAHVVDVPVPVDVLDLGAGAGPYEERLAPDRAHRAHRAVDAARDDLRRAPVQLV